eukprot:SAG11_NODE_2093_length_3834_cov_2.402945_5_plen_52_part_00
MAHLNHSPYAGWDAISRAIISVETVSANHERVLRHGQIAAGLHTDIAKWPF